MFVKYMCINILLQKPATRSNASVDKSTMAVESTTVATKKYTVPVKSTTASPPPVNTPKNETIVAKKRSMTFNFDFWLT